MIYQNVELFNVEEIIKNQDNSISFLRFPSAVIDKIESGVSGENAIKATSGVEIRFVLKGENVKLKMSTTCDGKFHIYRGGLQGGWYDHESHKLLFDKIEEFEITRPIEYENAKIMHDKSGYDWDYNVIRIILDKGEFKLFDIIGDVEPPKKEQCPKKTMLSYGSSITHGSNALDMSHSWVSVLAHKLNCDARNLGMAGSCFMEPSIIDYIASEGEKNHFDFATLELGVNVLGWSEDKLIERVRHTLTQIAGRNLDKKFFVISPFYLFQEEINKECKADLFRKDISNIVKDLNYKNVFYINGKDILSDCYGLSGDLIHPNIYGVQQIADRLYAKILDFV